MIKFFGIIFSILIVTGSLSAQETFSVIPIANDSTKNEYSPYLTYYWYDGFFSQEWWSSVEKNHPIWLTYIESSNEIDNKVVTKNMWFNQNHPNPFNAETTIIFRLERPSYVTLQLYDILGNEAQTVMKDVHHPAGRHSVRVDASALASGVFFYRLKAENKFGQMKKMCLLK